MMEFNHAFLRGILGTIVFVGALFAMNGIVANDRKQGFYRFLFAKPMTPSRYYGQAFFVHWAGFVAVMIAARTRLRRADLAGALAAAAAW